MIPIHDVKDIHEFTRNLLRNRDVANADATEKRTFIVKDILGDVKKNGDKAVRKYEEKFGASDGTSPLRVSKEDIVSAYSRVPSSQITALRRIHKTLTTTETETAKKLWQVKIDTETMCRYFDPIPSVGCYIPGGLAQYPSSAIMSMVPASVAGVRRIVVVSPPGSDGKVDPMTVAAAKLCGASEVYAVGGVQAIAALTYGTETIQSVDKIVGPGGAFVTAAKAAVQAESSVEIDMLAGPTELGIITDSSADPLLIALDLISQAEHSPDTSCYLVTSSKKIAIAVDAILDEIVPNIQRADIIKDSLKRNGFIAFCDSLSNVANLVNILAPEHLEVMVNDPLAMNRVITSPGVILVGKNTPSAASDYNLGSNHILPTGRSGRARGSLSVLDFVKLRTIVSTDLKALRKSAEPIKELTDAEDLPNHYAAISSRINPKTRPDADSIYDILMQSVPSNRVVMYDSKRMYDYQGDNPFPVTSKYNRRVCNRDSLVPKIISSLRERRGDHEQLHSNSIPICLIDQLPAVLFDILAKQIGYVASETAERFQFNTMNPFGVEEDDEDDDDKEESYQKVKSPPKNKKLTRKKRIKSIRRRENQKVVVIPDAPKSEKR